jgi:putative transposase
MDLTLRYRAYLDDEVASEGWRHINIHRQIRNEAVREYYRSPRDDRPSKTDQVNRLPEWKRNWPLFGEVSAHAAQQTVRQVHNDLSVLKEHRENGRKTGRLKWKGVGESRSIAYQSEGYNVDQNTGRDGWIRIRFSKIGWIGVRAHRDVPETGEVKRAVLKKERTGEWFVCLVVEADEPDKPDPETIDRSQCVGIDLGIESYIHTSDDLAVDCLDSTDSYDRYAQAQRKLARKDHGSERWEEQRQKVAKTKRKIKRQVLDFQHKLSTWLVREYDVVRVEDLDVTPMLETSQSAKNKQDAAWSRFLDLLEYKAGLYDTHVVRVDARGTTKECSACGVETRKPIWIHEHSCPACGHTEDCDLNAAKNILSRGIDQLNVGQGLSESTPVQTALPTFTRHSASVDAKCVVEAGSPASPYAR